jgi:phage gpG-like protein
MGTLFVVVADPQIEIDLQLVDRMVQLFAERDPIKLVLYRFLDAGNAKTFRMRSRPASKKRRGTKSREGWRRRAAGAMAI